MQKNFLSVIFLIIALTCFQFGQIVLGGIFILLTLATADIKSHRVH